MTGPHKCTSIPVLRPDPFQETSELTKGFLKMLISGLLNQDLLGPGLPQGWQSAPNYPTVTEQDKGLLFLPQSSTDQ